MNAVVIYESKYGATQHYAQWIAQALSCDLFTRKDFSPQRFAEYDVIIYGGGLYAGGVSGLSLLTKHADLWKEKPTVVFTCGLADPTQEDNVEGIRKALENALSPDLLHRVRLFHFRGAMDYAKLSFVHKSMMSMFCKMMAKKGADQLRQEDKDMIAAHGKAVDFTEEASIAPLVSYVKGLLLP